MQSKRSVRSAIVLASLVGLVAGCGTSIDSTVSALQVKGSSGVGLVADATTKGGQGIGGEAFRNGMGQGDRQGPGPGGMPFLAASLNLTDAQKTAIKAIQDKYRPAAKPANDTAQQDINKAQREVMKGIMTADVLDQAALKAALTSEQTAREADRASKQPQEVAMLAEIREVLTADQRASIANQPKPAAPPAGMAPPPMQGPIPLGKLALTDAQKSLFDALKPAAQTQPLDRGAAVAAFMQSGDQAALVAALQPPAPPAVDGVVAAFASLTKEQRTQLGAGPGGPLGLGGPGGPGGPGGHGGPEGRGGLGGPEGHGGPGGFGGHGGPGGMGAPVAADAGTTVTAGLGQ